ncbi:MAG: cupin domain-containing protein [Thiobacillus sp.]|nr:cupin domain-containing protein [Thiobacillus sp.]
MSDRSIPVAIMAADAPLRTRSSLYPEPVAAMLASRLSGRHKRPLGDLFGLKNFGVNLTRLEPNAVSSLRHAHERQDEFVFILQGCPSLLTNEGKTRLSPGMCAGFRAGTGNAHTLINETGEDVVYLEIGDRTSGDEVTYPDNDLHAQSNDGQWTFSHKDGTPY